MLRNINIDITRIPSSGNEPVTNPRFRVRSGRRNVAGGLLTANGDETYTLSYVVAPTSRLMDLLIRHELISMGFDVELPASDVL